MGHLARIPGVVACKDFGVKQHVGPCSGPVGMSAFTIPRTNIIQYTLRILIFQRIGKLCHYRFTTYFVALSSPSHCLNQCEISMEIKKTGIIIRQWALLVLRFLASGLFLPLDLLLEY